MKQRGLIVAIAAMMTLGVFPMAAFAAVAAGKLLSSKIPASAGVENRLGRLPFIRRFQGSLPRGLTCTEFARIASAPRLL